MTASRVMSPLHMLIIVFFLFSISTTMAFAQSNSVSDIHRPKSLDPMNRPMDELGVTGKDDTLCSDRWYSCTTYDRQQFDQKYPGQRLNELLRFGEPDWPDKDRRHSGYGSQKSDRIGHGDRLHDRLDKY